MLQLFKTIHIFGAAVFIGYGLFGMLWQAFLLGKTSAEIRRFVLLRLGAMDVILSVAITGLIMGGGFRMLRLWQVTNFELTWVWRGFLATVAAFFLLAFVIAPLTLWSHWLIKKGKEQQAARLIPWLVPLRLAYLAMPVFATITMVYK